MRNVRAMRLGSDRIAIPRALIAATAGPNSLALAVPRFAALTGG